jgi:hypothetical protein
MRIHSLKYALTVAVFLLGMILLVFGVGSDAHPARLTKVARGVFPAGHVVPSLDLHRIKGGGRWKSPHGCIVSWWR